VDVRFVTGAVGAAVVAVVVSGCGGSSNPAPAGSGHVVPIVERDFAIKLPGRIAAGHVTFAVKNDGPDQHELIVVRLSDRPLPMRRDGITIDEEKLGAAEVGSLEPGPPGSERRLSLDLKPGRYRVFCNMYGHYMSGMSADVLAT
jgi:uncharacterized cupredoxin-like copper-binding protein